ncbi:MAG TPA: aminodeoxychorismate/anthranilate synthase component II [Planctomycetaceae bacterium]|jgi:anthranilate synthase/aminodeoxychorismate synthase-like glutamine amidotransferase
MILLIDNYDSFVYNLARYLAELGCETHVVRNDAISVAKVADLAPQAIVISPGPCTPHEAGISMALIRELGPQIPMLGVCLGHQALAAALGGRIVRAPKPVHGRISLVHHACARLFAGLPNPLRATRYHSLLVEESTLPAELRIVARTVDGLPMALEHATWPAFGVQFHPESVLTESGHRLLANFLAAAGIATNELPLGDVPAGAHRVPDADDVWWATEPLHAREAFAAGPPLPPQV